MYTTNIDIRWADLDPNFHVLHSKYYDFCAFSRTKFLYDHDINAELMLQLKLGPILFHEECFFKKEIRFGDRVTVTTQIAAASQNFSRWKMSHQIIVGENKIAALIHVDGAWMDTVLRKLTIPPQQIATVFENAPRTEAFKYI